MKSSFLRVAALILCLTATVSGQNVLRNFNFDFSAGGARSQAMGKTSIAISDDIFGGTGNPAGIYMLELPTIAVSYSLFSPRGHTDITQFSPLVSDHKGTFKSITSANFVAPVRIKGHKFVATVNYYRDYAEYETVSTRDVGNAPVTSADTFFISLVYPVIALFNDDSSSTSELTQYDQTDGGLYTVNFGFGTRLYGDFSFGAAVNVYTGNMQRIGRAVHTLDGVYSEIIAPSQPAEYVFRADIVDTLKFSGINFNLGLKYNKERFTAGLLVRTPLSLGVGTEETALFNLYVNGVPREDFGTSMLTPKIDPPLSKYELPLMVGLGFSYKVNENLLVAAETELRQYSSTTIKRRDSLLIGASGNNTEYYTEFKPSDVEFMKWKDAMVFRLGGEYLKETGFGTIPIRAGFGYVPVPPSSIESIDQVAFSAKSVANVDLSVGTGIHWEQIKLDLAYTYTIRNKELVYVDYKYKNHSLNFSFTGVF